MGSGTSKSSTNTDGNHDSPTSKTYENLPGSSVPPTGLPIKATSDGNRDRNVPLSPQNQQKNGTVINEKQTTHRTEERGLAETHGTNREKTDIRKKR